MESRHFPYQHPTFGTDKRPAPVSAWKDTVYYWWWEYLRRHGGYKRTCQQGGKGRFAKLYVEFGDVHSSDFKTWWKERAVALFSEPKKEKLFALVEGQIAQEDLDNPNLLFIQVPLNLPIRSLKQRFDALLKKHHQGRQGIRHARSSHAKYPVIGQPNVNALMTTLKVYDYRQAHPEMSLWQIGMILDQFKSFDPNKREGKQDGNDEKNIMAATVSRYLRKAEAMITNAGIGRFPDTTDDKSKETAKADKT
jgi:hypothetical protein